MTPQSHLLEHDTFSSGRWSGTECLVEPQDGEERVKLAHGKGIVGAESMSLADQSKVSMKLPSLLP